MAFPYQPEVVKKIPILLFFYWEMWNKKSEVRVPHRYLMLPPAPPLFSSKISMKKRKDEFFYSLNPSSGLTGLEPAASALTGRCSDQLNYNPRGVYGILILK